MPLTIHGFECGLVATNSYLIIDEATRTAAIIDLPNDSLPTLLAACARERVKPSSLLLTHSHWDHTADLEHALREWPGLPVLIHRDDAYRLADPMAHTVWPLPFTMQPVEPTGWLEHGDEIVLGETRLRILHTPGHTEGSVTFYSELDEAAIVGDTLFAGSVGRTDLPGGSWPVLERSIHEQLLGLPDDTAVYPGHGPVTSIGDERRSNPFLRV